MVWHQHLNASWSYTPFQTSKHLWIRPLHWKMSAVVWKISVSERETRRLLFATTEARLRFQGQKQGDPRLLSQGPSDNFMPGIRSTHTIQWSPAMLVVNKGIMLNSARSQETRHPSRTMVETIQPPRATTSSQQQPQEGSPEPCDQGRSAECPRHRDRYVPCQHSTCHGFV